VSALLLGGGEGRTALIGRRKPLVDPERLANAPAPRSPRSDASCGRIFGRRSCAEVKEAFHSCYVSKIHQPSMFHIIGNEVTGEDFESGYLATNQEFENVRIRVEYKWGMKQFSPHSISKRNNGLLCGLVGTHKV
jgi:hypothetical protein